MDRKEAVSLRFDGDIKRDMKIYESTRKKTAEVKDRGVFNMLRSIPVKVDLIKVKF